MTTSGNGQAWSSPSHRGQWRTGKDGGNWLRDRLWCPNDPRGSGIYDDDDESADAAAACQGTDRGVSTDVTFVVLLKEHSAEGSSEGLGWADHTVHSAGESWFRRGAVTDIV